MSERSPHRRTRQHVKRDERIAQLRAKGVTVGQLAERFNLSPRDIHNILAREKERQ